MIGQAIYDRELWLMDLQEISRMIDTHGPRTPDERPKEVGAPTGQIVWLLLDDVYSAQFVVGVFSDEEKAKYAQERCKLHKPRILNYRLDPRID